MRVKVRKVLIHICAEVINLGCCRIIDRIPLVVDVGVHGSKLLRHVIHKLLIAWTRESSRRRRHNFTAFDLLVIANNIFTNVGDGFCFRIVMHAHSGVNILN